MEPSLNGLNSGRPPLGIYTSRCDDKGRVRLPKEFEEFLRPTPETEFFITSLDGRIARVYPMPVWLANERILAEFDENPKAAKDIAYLADYYGGVSTVDGQGRVLVPQLLRRKLAIEDQKVNLRFYRGAIELYSEAESERRLQRAAEAMEANLDALEKRGLK